MEIINSVKELKEKVSALRSDGKTVGLVPTMGALHAGHASLVTRSVKENDATVVSVFVNPTQFNDKKDFGCRLCPVGEHRCHVCVRSIGGGGLS